MGTCVCLLSRRRSSAAHRAAHQLVAEKASSGDGRTKITGLIGREVPDGEAFMDLVDCPTTFPKGMSR